MCLLLLVNLAPFYRVETKPRWDIAAKIYAAQARPQDVAYYEQYCAVQIMRYYLPPPLRYVLLLDADGDWQHAERAFARGQRVWAIYGYGCNRICESPAKFRASLASLGSPCAEFHAGGGIIMWRYDPARR
jgi:hypothetical protein